MKFKTSLLLNNYFSDLYHSSNEIMNDPMLILPQEIHDFNLVLNDKDDYEKYIKYIYFNRNHIFDILFDLEDKINIEDMTPNNKLKNKFEVFLYYLCLLIEENKDIVYFIYSSDFIKNIKTNFIKKDTNDIFINIILSKILTVLINNYIAENDLNSNRELINIKNELEELIKNKYESFKECNLDLSPEIINSKNLDDIYLYIILSIIKSETYDYKKAIKILQQLNLEEIDIINKNIYEKINSAINERTFKKKYLIQKLEDFSDKNKLNMYFILLKYIFKDTLYIYQIPFLLEARKTLLKYIQKYKEQILSNLNNNQIFVLEKLFDNDYYIKKYIKEKEFEGNNSEIEIEEINIDNIEEIEDNKDINEVLAFYKNYKFETKKNDIEFIETSLKTKDKLNYEKYLTDLKEAKEMNPKFDIIKFYHINSGNKNKPLLEKEFKKSADSFKNIEKIIRDKKLNKINNKANKILYEYFKNPEKTEQILELFKKDEYDLFIKFNRLKEILQYYKNFLFESKKNEIKSIDNIVKEISHNNDDINIYLKDFEIAEKMNLRYQIILLIYKIKFEEDKVSNQEKLGQIVYIWNKHIEKAINNKQTKYNELSYEVKNELLKFFNKKENEEYLIKIFDIDSIEFFRNLEFSENELELKFVNQTKNEEKIEIQKEKIIEIQKEEKIKEINKSLIPRKSSDEIEFEETAYQTGILSELIKYNEDFKVFLNKQDLLLMIEIYGDKKNRNEIKKEQFGILSKKYIALKNIIKDRRKNKLNRNIKKEAEKYFKDIKNKEKILKVFSQDDINWLLNQTNEKVKENPIKIEIKKEEFDPEIINKLGEVLSYYKNFYPEKKDDINAINEILKEQNKNCEKINKYLIEYENSKNMNLRYPFIEYLFEIRKREKKAKSIKDVFAAWETIENTIKNNKFNRLKEKKNILIFFREEKNKNTILKIFTEEQFNSVLDEKNLGIRDKNIIISKPPQEKFNPEITNNLEIILNYYKNFFFETKKDEIILLEKAINQGEKINYETFIKDLEEAKKMNKRYKIIDFLFNEENKGKKKTENDFKKVMNSYKNIVEKAIKDKRFSKLKQNLKNHITTFFNNDDNKKLLFEIFTQEEIDQVLKPNSKKISNEKISDEKIYNEKISKEKISNGKISDENINKLNIILEYYNNFCFISKSVEILEIPEIIKNNKNNFEKYFKDFDFETAKKKNLRYPLIKIIFNHSKKAKTEENLEESFKTWNLYENMIKKGSKKIPRTIKMSLIEYFNKIDNEERLIEIFGKENYENFKNENNKTKEKKKKISEENINNLKIVLKYYENYLFETNKDDIIFLKDAIEKGDEFDYKRHLENIEEKRIMNDKYPIIELIFKSNNKGKEKTEKEINKAKGVYDKTIEKPIKDGKINRLNKSLKEALIQFFNNIDNHPSLLKLFTQEQIDKILMHNTQKISAENINKLKEILDYYNNYCLESKNKEKNEIAEIIKKETGKFEEYLKDFDEAKKMNLRYPIIEFLLNNKKKVKNENNLKEIAKSWTQYEGMIKKGSWNRMGKDIKKQLFEYFNKEENKKGLLEIFEEDKYNFFRDEKNHPELKKKKNNENDINNLKIILKYYQNYLFETKKDAIILLEKAIKGQDINYKKYLSDLDISKIRNDEFPIIDYLFNEFVSKDKEKIKNETKIDEQVKKFETFKKFIKERKDLKKLPKPTKKAMTTYFKKEENKKILLKIFTQDEFDWFLNSTKEKISKKKLSKEIISDLNIVLNNYKNYYFESKKDEINFLEDAIKKEDEFDYKKYLENLEEFKKKNDRFPIIEYIFNKKNIDMNKNEKEIQILLEKFEIFERSMKERNNEEIYLYLEENNQYILFDYFKDLSNKEILLKIFNEEEIELFLENEIINEENLTKLKEIKKYYENFLLNEKSDEINSLNNIIKNRKGKYEAFLKDLDKAKYMNLRYPLIICLLDDKKENNKKNFVEAKQHWERIEQMIKDKKSIEKMKNINIIMNKLKEDKIKKILYQIIEKDALDYFFKKIEEAEEKAREKKKINEIKKKSKLLLKLYKENYPNAKEKEIKFIELFLTNGKSLDFEKFLKEHKEDYEEAKKMKKEESVGDYLDKNGEKISDKKGFLKDHVKLINEGKNKKMKKHYKNIMLKYIEKEEKEEITNQYFTKEQRDKLKNNF